MKELFYQDVEAINEALSNQNTYNQSINNMIEELKKIGIEATVEEVIKILGDCNGRRLAHKAEKFNAVRSAIRDLQTSKVGDVIIQGLRVRPSKFVELFDIGELPKSFWDAVYFCMEWRSKYRADYSQKNKKTGLMELKSDTEDKIREEHSVFIISEDQKRCVELLQTCCDALNELEAYFDAGILNADETRGFSRKENGDIAVDYTVIDSLI